MFDYDRFKSAALALVGALALSAVTVGAAVGPATSFAAAPVSAPILA